MVNFIVEAKRQISLSASDTIKNVEQWKRQSCAMFDMVQHQVLRSHEDRHESIAVNNNMDKKMSKKATVSGSSAKKSSTAAKKPYVRTKKLKKIAKKPSVTATAAPAAASKTLVKKPSTAVGTAKKTSTSSIEQKVANPSKGTAQGSTNHISDFLPDLSSDSSSDEATENLPAAEKASCPSMPSMLLLTNAVRQSHSTITHANHDVFLLCCHLFIP